MLLARETAIRRCFSAREMLLATKWLSRDTLQPAERFRPRIELQSTAGQMKRLAGLVKRDQSTLESKAPGAYSPAAAVVKLHVIQRLGLWVYVHRARYDPGPATVSRPDIQLQSVARFPVAGKARRLPDRVPPADGLGTTAVRGTTTSRGTTTARETTTARGTTTTRRTTTTPRTTTTRRTTTIHGATTTAGRRATPPDSH